MLDELEAQMKQRGEAVRQLKAASADKPAVEQAVGELQKAKAALTAAVEAALALVPEGSAEHDALQARLPAPPKPKGKDKKKEAPELSLIHI